MTELLDAVDALTKPRTTRIIQPIYETTMRDGRPETGPDGNPTRHITGTRAVKLVHDPLLQQLDDAIRGTMTATDGAAASLKFTRGVLNGDALYQFVRIASTITDWARAVNVEHTPDPVVLLRRWYFAYTNTDPEPASVAWHVRKLRGWETLIGDVIDPWRPMPLAGPCPNPECPQQLIDGLWFYWDQRTREQGNRPLLVEYREGDGSERVEAWARARCRACGTVWSSPRALQFDREHAQVGSSTDQDDRRTT